MTLDRSGFWRDFWALFKPYWFSEEKVIARLLLFAILGLALGMVYMNVQINAWQNLFFNTLQDKNKPEFYRQILRFSLLAGVWIVMNVYSLYLTQMLQVRWRRWLTDKYLKDWLADRTYYPMAIAGTQADNPDQRIAEDLKIFVDQTLGLSIGLLNAWSRWCLSSACCGCCRVRLPVPIFGEGFSHSGLHGVGRTALCSTRQLARAYDRQAAHRAQLQSAALSRPTSATRLVRFRENMEGVALYRGEADELRSFGNGFQSIFSNWWAIMRQTKQLTWFTSGYGQLAVIFPFVVAAPRFFSGAIPLGGLMQTASAFGFVRESLSWFISVSGIRAVEGDGGSL